MSDDRMTPEQYIECVLMCYGELRDEKGRPPSIVELADYAGIDYLRTRNILRARGLPVTDGRSKAGRGRRG